MGINDLGPHLYRYYNTAYLAKSNPIERLQMAIAERTDQSVTPRDAYKMTLGKIPTANEMRGRYSRKNSALNLIRLLY